MIQETLQNHDRGQLVELLLPFGPVSAPLDQQLLGGKRRQPFVPQAHFNTRCKAQPFCETVHVQRLLTDGAIHIQWVPYHDMANLVFLYESRQGFEILFCIGSVKRGYPPGDQAGFVAHRYSNPSFTNVQSHESHDRRLTSGRCQSGAEYSVRSWGCQESLARKAGLLLQSLQQLNLTGVVDIVIRHTVNQRQVAHFAVRRSEAQRSWLEAGHNFS